MKTLAAILLFCSSGLLADTAERVIFRGVMLPENEVPAAAIQGRAYATLIAHIVRDDNGKVVSGTMGFNIVPDIFLGPVSVLELRRHTGPAATPCSGRL